MRITFVLPFASLAGGVRVVATYARHLHERGHEVTVVSQPRAPHQSTSPKARLKRLLGREAPNAPPVRTPLLDFLGPRHIVLDRPRPVEPGDLPEADIVFATWWETAEWVARLPDSRGRKFYLLQDYETFSEATAARVIASYDLPLKKIAVSTYIRDVIAEAHGIDGIEVVPNAVDLAQFDAPPRARNAALTVGFLYTPTPRKNVKLAIEVLETAKARLPGLRARVFGSTPVVPNLPLPGWAAYEEAPPQDRIPGIYAGCDLWLFTSDHEGFGLPILEAMACRTPVLATRAGAAPDLVNGRNGMLLPGAPQAFAEEIARFAAMSDAEWQGYSAAAYETATAYSWDDATDRLLACLQAETAA